MAAPAIKYDRVYADNSPFVSISIPPNMSIVDNIPMHTPTHTKIIPLAIFPTYTCPRPASKKDSTAARPVLFKGSAYVTLGGTHVFLVPSFRFVPHF